MSGLTGSCPTLTFTVNGTLVKTNSATRFEETGCADIRSGDRAEVKGLRQSDGSVLAQKVEVEKEEVEADATPKTTKLDTQWQRLMSLCASESRFRAEGNHPRLLKLLKADIDQLAREMGFNERLIVTRDFRERHGDHITRIITE